MKLLFFYFITISSFAQPILHDRWKSLFNTSVDSIHQAYTPNAVLITPYGKVYRTSEDRAAFYSKLKSEVGEIKSVTTLHQAEVTPDLRFEIGYFVTSNTRKFKYLIIGKKVNNEFVREIEILSESNSELPDPLGINEARNLWMKLCNSHQADELVSNVYAVQAIYYTNNRVLIGTVDITREYRYMNNPAYQLRLTPNIVEAAGKNLAFEIGQCSGSYQGKYALVWTKIGNDWKVIFDSN